MCNLGGAMWVLGRVEDVRTKCVPQVRFVKSIQQNGKDVFSAFMNLETAYDTINRHGMWQMLRVYGVEENC